MEGFEAADWAAKRRNRNAAWRLPESQSAEKASEIPGFDGLSKEK
jgi:hypothetical protein